jgi:hypothetical protein
VAAQVVASRAVLSSTELVSLISYQEEYIVAMNLGKKELFF